MIEIVWTVSAENYYLNLLTFVTEQWDIQVAQYLESSVKENIKRITINPNLFPQLKHRKPIRKCVVNEHVSFLYQVKENQIIVLLFIDNRSDHIYY